MTPRIPKEPFAKIAVSCSGGGYRAASFHLGALAYLDRAHYQGKPLLENVKLISTVSGGTITGVVYAQKKQEGKSFKAIYDFLMLKLHTLDLVKLSIEKLNPNQKPRNPEKRKNLINAFAELYDIHFTEGATFKVFNTMNAHLEAVVFNSTEFNTGNNFRFRNRGTGYFGNNAIRVSETTAEEVKLADAIASSACFPGGFEPMIWPHDFAHDKSPNLKTQKKTSPGVGLMDGGIYDNQGIQSILLYERKKSEERHNTPGEPYFDLIIISDVASPYMTPFKYAQENNKEGLRSFTLGGVKQKARSINRTLNVSLITLAFIFAALPILWRYSFASFYTGLCLGLTAMPVVLLIVKRFLITRLSKIQDYGLKFFNKIPPYFRERFSTFKIEDISVHRAEPLLLDRFGSLISLLMDVFLKVVRRLNYNALYEDETFKYRRISNLIKELTEEDFNQAGGRRRAETEGSQTYRQQSKLRDQYTAVVSQPLQKMIEEAASFGTTLWFTEDNALHSMLDKLVATGQCTMCYNLIDYLEQILYVDGNGFNELSIDTQNALKELYENCLKDWEKFNANPLFMVEEMH